MKWRRGRILTEYRRTTTVPTKKKSVEISDASDACADVLSPPPDQLDSGLTFKSITRSISAAGFGESNDFKKPDKRLKSATKRKRSIPKSTRRPSSVKQDDSFTPITRAHPLSNVLYPIPIDQLNGFTNGISDIDYSNYNVTAFSPHFKPRPISNAFLSKVPFPMSILSNAYSLIDSGSDDFGHCRCETRSCAECVLFKPINEVRTIDSNEKIAKITTILNKYTNGAGDKSEGNGKYGYEEVLKNLVGASPRVYETFVEALERGDDYLDIDLVEFDVKTLNEVFGI